MSSEIAKYEPKPKLISISTYKEALHFAEMVAKSSFCPASFRDKAGDVMIAMQWGDEIGLAPLQALQNIAVINGKPGIYGDAALALVQSSGMLIDIREELDTQTMTYTCSVKRKGRATETVRSFSKSNAQTAKLWGKAGPWTQYPERMLQMRARTLALRDAFPDVLMGLGIAEELQDYPEQAQPDGLGAIPERKSLPQTEQYTEAEIVEEPERASKEQRLFIAELLKALKMNRAQADEMTSRLYNQTWATLTVDNAEDFALELHERVSVIEAEKSAEKAQQGGSR